MEPQSVQHSIEPPEGVWVKFRDELVHVAYHLRWWQLSQLQAATILSGQLQKLNMIHILSWTPFLWDSSARLSAREATIDGVSCPQFDMFHTSPPETNLIWINRPEPGPSEVKKGKKTSNGPGEASWNPKGVQLHTKSTNEADSIWPAEASGNMRQNQVQRWD